MAAAGHHNRVTDVEMLARLAPISGWEVFIKETDGSWSGVGTWDAELRRVTFA